MSVFHRGPHDLEMIREEHGHTGGIDAGIPGKKVIVLDEIPTSPNKSNPSLVVSYNAAGDVVKLEKTISGVKYTKTISNADSTVATQKTISAWS